MNLKNGKIIDFPLATEQAMDSELLENGLLRLLPAAAYERYERLNLVAWCMKKGLFTLPTVELIQWLQAHVIRWRKTIEICSGANRLGAYLGIPMTDSYLQQNDPMIALTSLLTGHAVVKPQRDVERLTADAAVAKYQPEVVIASWSVELGNDMKSSKKGVDENAIIDRVQCYCLIGTPSVHGEKTILKRPHRELTFPWLVGRSFTGENRIWLWEKPE